MSKIEPKTAAEELAEAMLAAGAPASFTKLIDDDATGQHVTHLPRAPWPEGTLYQLSVVQRGAHTVPTMLQFQQGELEAVGPNGVTPAALLSALVHHLETRDAAGNAKTLGHLRKAAAALTPKAAA